MVINTVNDFDMSHRVLKPLDLFKANLPMYSKRETNRCWERSTRSGEHTMGE